MSCAPKGHSSRPLEIHSMCSRSLKGPSETTSPTRCQVQQWCQATGAGAQYVQGKAPPSFQQSLSQQWEGRPHLQGTEMRPHCSNPDRGVENGQCGLWPPDDTKRIDVGQQLTLAPPSSWSPLFSCYWLLPFMCHVVAPSLHLWLSWVSYHGFLSPATAGQKSWWSRVRIKGGPLTDTLVFPRFLISILFIPDPSLA